MIKKYTLTLTIKLTGISLSLILTSILLVHFETDIAADFFLAVSWSTILSAFLNQGATQRLITKIPKGSALEIPRLVLNETAKIIVLFIFLLIVFFIGYNLGFLESFIVKILIIGFLLTISRILYTVLRAINHGNIAELIDIVIRNGLYILSLFVCINYFHLDVHYSLIFVLAIIVIIYLLLLRRYLVFTEMKYDIKLHKYFDYYTAYNFLNISRSHIPLILVGIYLKPHHVEIYKLGQQLSNMVAFGAMSVNVTQSPRISKLIGSSDIKDLQSVYSKGYWFALYVGLISFLLILLLFPFINTLFFRIDAELFLIFLFLLPQLVYVIAGPSLQFLLLYGRVKKAFYLSFIGFFIILFGVLFLSTGLTLIHVILLDLLAIIVTHFISVYLMYKFKDLIHPVISKI